MALDKLGSFSGLRIFALKAKEFTLEKVAELSRALEDIFKDINESLEALEGHAGSAHANPNAEENVIISVRRNGVILPPTNKAVDINVPVNVTDLTNDAGFVSQTEVDNAVRNSGHLKKRIVDELPSISNADENTIYYVRKNDGEVGNQYEEYQFINGVAELIGSGADLSGYATTDSVAKASNNAVTSIFNTLASSDEKYLGTGNLAAFWSLLKPLLNEHESSINDLLARVSLLELVLTANVSGNSFYVTFDSLTDMAVTGVWNVNDKRVEF